MYGPEFLEPVSPSGTEPPKPPFASVDDLASRWHAFTSEERPRVEAVLDDASDVIMTYCPLWAEASPATLRRITCAIAKRALLGADTAGVSQSTQTAGPYTESFSYSNPAGDLYLTKAEKQALGCGRQHLWSIDLAGGSTS